MKRFYLFTIVSAIAISAVAQVETDLTNNRKKKVVNFDIGQLPFSGVNTARLALPEEILFPVPGGDPVPVLFSETLISESKIESIQTYKGTSADGKIKINLTVTDRQHMTGIMRTEDGYFFIEPIKGAEGQYILYQKISEFNQNTECNSLGEHVNEIINSGNLRQAAGSLFPVGEKIRNYRLAIAATGEFVNFYGDKNNALVKIVSLVNAINLIYELELNIHFTLISATTSKTILFDDPGTDPFDPDLSFANATRSQEGFDYMHSQSILKYSAYDIGHTLNVYTASGIRMRGQAGISPCIDNQKSNGWTEWTNNTNFDIEFAGIVSIVVHEIAHQFGANHTFNGTSGICTGAWDFRAAVEPGGGTTLMGYNTNCGNYTVRGIFWAGDHTYFHTFSLNQIFETVNNVATCYTETDTNNQPPVATVGPDISIPKGTPFTLRGSAVDPNNDLLTYSWDQMDIATAGDKGAFGNSYYGAGAYTAVNSTTAPLFRSRQSFSSERTFPDESYVASKDANVSYQSAEHLPQVARELNFNFTVRDYNGSGSGMDSKPFKVTISNTGPFKITSHIDEANISSGNTLKVDWNVNSTNTQAPNLILSFSIDGGQSFPYVISDAVPNSGTYSFEFPDYIPYTKNGRYKLSYEINEYAEFFYINKGDITVNSSTCEVQRSQLYPAKSVTAQVGSGELNLPLRNGIGTKMIQKSMKYKFFKDVSTSTGYMHANSSMTGCGYINYSLDYQMSIFTVEATGFYTIGSWVDDYIYRTTYYAVFNNETFNCSNFVGSNSYFSGGGFSWNGTSDIYLEAGKTYYLVSYFLETPTTFTLEFSGPGEVYEGRDLETNYTYFAIDQSDMRIKLVNDASNFTGLDAGTYKVYGLSYQSDFNKSSLVGKTMSEAMALSGCKLPSSNYVSLYIKSDNNCPPIQNLTGIAMAGKTQASETINSTQIVGSGKNVTYQAAKSILLIPLEGSGFMVDIGAVFTAKIKECD